MYKDMRGRESEWSRRALLTTSGGMLVAAAGFGLVPASAVGQQRPKRGGTLRFATRSDATGLDPHRNLMYLVSNCLAATTMGLLDLNLQSEPVPGVASAWKPLQIS
jgi:ABC-type oligopeptide transport system substrate-binding subunit